MHKKECLAIAALINLAGTLDLGKPINPSLDSWQNNYSKSSEIALAISRFIS